MHQPPKRVVVGVAVPVFMIVSLWLTVPPQAAEPSRQSGAETIVVGSEVDFPPYAVVDAQGQPDGFSVELFKAVADAMGLRVRFDPGEWNIVWEALKRGDIDALPLVARSPERAALVDLTVPHTTTYDSFFVRKGSTVPASLAEAEGREIIVMRGDAAHEELQRRGFRGTLVLTSTIPEAMRLLASGRHDAVLVSKLIGHMVLNKTGLDDVIRAGPPLREYQREFAFAVTKGNVALKDRLEQGIAIVKATKRYDAIYAKWLGALEPPRFPLATLVWWVAIPSGLALLLAAWSLSLRRENRLRREHEQALSESEARLKKVLEVQTVGVMFWDLKTGRMTDANDTFLDMMGYSRREVEAGELSWQKLTPQEYMEASLAEIRKFQATGRLGPYEKEYFRKDGTRQWLVFAGSSLGSDACVEFCVDIADRKNAEDALRDSRARLQSEAAALARLNEASSRLWAMRDLGMGLDEVLSAAIDLLGADMGKVQLLDAKRNVLEIAAHRGFGQDFLDFFREVSANAESSSGRALRSHQRILIEDVETDSAYEPFRAIARAAGYRAVQSTPLIGRDGTPLGMISTYFRSVHRPSEEELRRLDLYARQATDFIERHRTDEALRRAEEERQTLQAELFHATRLSEIGKMAAALAHELNQPLAAVATYIGGCRRLLASVTDDEQSKRKLREVMEQVSAQALRAGEIIRRLREFVGSGERERSLEDAGGLMQEACNLAITLAKHDGISVRSDIKRTGPVLVDKVQFQQVIINLTRNAVEAMENSRRKELVFGLAKNGAQIEVSVSDTGPGIDPDIAGRLFKPFSTTKSGGMGIGLSICREIVEAHEGKIWAEPNPNGGTVFRFTVPLVAGLTGE